MPATPFPPDLKMHATYLFLKIYFNGVKLFDETKVSININLKYSKVCSGSFVSRPWSVNKSILQVIHDKHVTLYMGHNQPFF